MSCLQFDGAHKVVTGSYDKCVKAWDLRFPTEPVLTVQSHQGAVFCLRFDETRLVTGGADHFLKIFDFKTSTDNFYNMCSSNSFYVK